MAHATDFHGSNRVFAAPPGREDVSDLHTFVNGSVIVSAWRLTDEELEEVNRTGVVFLSSFSGMTLFPVAVGSESAMRRLVADYGPVWHREPANDGGRCEFPGTPCAARGCTLPGEVWPTILLPRGEGDEAPARLEIPRTMCSAHQEAFQPQDFLTAESRAVISGMMESWGFAQPDFEKVEVRWRSVEDPALWQFDGTEARLMAPEQGK